ncbi:MAG: LytTR family DNA-binding domain-containing protein [Pseudomonadota bacterium]
MSLRVLLVDDEHLARERIKRMLATDAAFAVAGEASNGREAVELCHREQPDLVLLDIRMPGMDGLEAASHLAEMDQPPAVIFCTAYEEHAVQAFNLQAVGYLLKPVRKDDLLAALTQAQRVNKAQLAALAAAEGAPRIRSHISARTRRGVELIPIDQVRFLQADQKYVTVGHDGGEVIVDDTLRELEDEFGDRFVRVHRNALVAVAHIQGLEKRDDGGVCVRLRDSSALIDVSRRHLAAVRQFIKQL